MTEERKPARLKLEDDLRLVDVDAFELEQAIAGMRAVSPESIVVGRSIPVDIFAPRRDQTTGWIEMVCVLPINTEVTDRQINLVKGSGLGRLYIKNLN